LRTRLISDLAELDPVGLDAADRFAVELGISLDFLSQDLEPVPSMRH